MTASSISSSLRGRSRPPTARSVGPRARGVDDGARRDGLLRGSRRPGRAPCPFSRPGPACSGEGSRPCPSRGSRGDWSSRSRRRSGVLLIRERDRALGVQPRHPLPGSVSSISPVGTPCLRRARRCAAAASTSFASPCRRDRTRPSRNARRRPRSKVAKKSRPMPGDLGDEIGRVVLPDHAAGTPAAAGGQRVLLEDYDLRQASLRQMVGRWTPPGCRPR